jgi:hypothetical protein
LAGDEEPVPVASHPWYQEALAEPDPPRSLRLHARNVVRMQQRYADLDEVLQMAAAADDELTQLWQITEDQRRTGAGFIIDALLRKGRSNPASTSSGPSPHPTSSGASPTTGNGRSGVSSNGSATPSANSSCPARRHTHSHPGVRYPAGVRVPATARDSPIVPERPDLRGSSVHRRSSHGRTEPRGQRTVISRAPRRWPPVTVNAQAVDLYFYASAGRTSVSAAFRFRQSRKAA